MQHAEKYDKFYEENDEYCKISIKVKYLNEQIMDYCNLDKKKVNHLGL